MTTLSTMQRLRQTIRLRSRLFDLRNPVPLDVLETYRRFREHPQGMYVLGTNDVRLLYNLVRRRKPLHCLEFGSGLGAGTAVIARAMAENGKGTVTAIEQHAWILDISKELIPRALQDRIRFVHAEPQILEIDDAKMSGYKLPQDIAPADFVLVDGPGSWEGADGKPVKLPNGDVLTLVPKFPPGTMIYIDGRWGTVDAIQRGLTLRGRPFHAMIDKRNAYSTIVLE